MDDTTMTDTMVVVESGEPMHLARFLMGTRYQTATGRPGLRFWRGSFYHWYAGQWVKREHRWVENDLYRALENVQWAEAVGRGQTVMQRCAPDSRMVAEVARCLEVVQEVGVEKAPCWLVPNDEHDPMHCVAFQDRVVDVQRTAEAWDGVGPIPWVTFERTEDYFEPVVLPVEFDADAQCPVYEQKLGEWFTDPVSRELFLRSSGYLLMPTRKYQRGTALIGRIRGGKGTNTRLYKRLLGPAYFGTSMRESAGTFGLQGAEASRAIVISECTDLESAAGQVFAGIWKNIVGEDEQTVNRKHLPSVRCVLGANVVMVSNQMPRLPNKGEGMSGKMLFVPFDHSFRGAEDFNLNERLDGELAGIARVMVEGAVRLEKEPRADRKWPVSERTQALLDQYRILNNPFDAFLEARFVRVGTGFASAVEVRRQWHDWRSRNQVRLHVSENQLLMKLEEESSWGVVRARFGAESIPGLRGMALRSDVSRGEVDDVL